ncbi:MAG: hypothetical protein GX446_03340 [Chthonomonadales bacterium]|nr:hypothetical protein [Chthonomonadales bacterium]
MRSVMCAITLALVLHAAAIADNPVTNGGFEVLDSAYFPRDWSPVGAGVEVTTEARSGRYALRINRMASKPMPAETGLNRGWAPGGAPGAMLEQTKGTLRAWIKVRSASPDATISLVVIPMGRSGVEDTGEMRAMRNVPNEYAGDGTWHELRLAYDYSARQSVRWVHVGMRLVGGPVDVVVDDMELLEGPVPILELEKVHVYPDKADPAARAMLTATVANEGTMPSGPVSVVVHLPDGISATGPADPIELVPGDGKTLRWQLRGKLAPGRVVIRATAATGVAERVVRLEPRMEIYSALLRPGIVAPRAAARLAVTLWNRGTASSGEVRVELRTFGGVRASDSVLVFAPIPPGRRAVREIEVRAPTVASLAGGVECRIRGAADGFEPVRVSLETTDAVRSRPVPALAGVQLRTGADRTMADFGQSSSRAPLARMPHLGRITARLPNGRVQTLTARYGAPTRSGNVLTLRSVQRDSAGATWSFTAAFTRLSSRATRLTIAVSTDRQRRVALFEGPMLLVGEGAYGSLKSEAIFPGLEWLVDDEVSSSDLDILASHPDRPRYAPHPNKVTIPAMAVSGRFGTAALLWSAADRWDGQHDRPQPVFASPDRIGGIAAHRLGLIAPSPVELDRSARGGLVREAHYTREAAAADALRDIILRAGQELRLSAVLYAGPSGSSALDGVEEWFAWHRPAAPAPAPRGSDREQVAWSMEAYLRTLWSGPDTGWYPYLLGPAIWRRPALNPTYAYDLLQAVRLLPEDPRRQAWEDRLRSAGFMAPADTETAERVPTAEDLQFAEGDPVTFLIAHANASLELISAQAPDGSYSFDADRRDAGVFKGYDFHELGEPGAVEIGLIAAKAYQLLQIARIVGDRSFYEAGVRSLNRMERYRVPRAAQVWEVPVHTPDILAAADAVDAYLEAYWYSGERKWLERARIWARRGLPFVYFWNAPGKLWMRYGSIPVFGASQMRGSWFGNVVQWNGLRYAFALLKLYRHDPEARYGGLSWRDIAVGITRSAMYQQSDSPDLLTLWPDSLHTITGVRAAWEFAPRQILKNVTWWLGWPEMPLTVRAKTPDGRIIRVSGLGHIGEVRASGNTLSVRVQHPSRGRGSVLIAGVSAPSEVRMGDQQVPRVSSRIVAGRPGWRYDPRLRAVAVHIPHGGDAVIRLSGIRAADPDLAVARVDRLSFEFDDGFEGWSAQNDTAELEVRDGQLQGRSSGGDPFLVRPNCHIIGSDIREVVVRIRADGHGGGQFYWTTAASPAFDEQKVFPFTFPADGEWHEVSVPVTNHPHWRGQIVTGLRIDPVNAANVSFAIDWVRAR